MRPGLAASRSRRSNHARSPASPAALGARTLDVRARPPARRAIASKRASRSAASGSHGRSSSRTARSMHAYRTSAATRSGMARGEDRRQRPAGRVGEQRRALAAGGVEHRVRCRRARASTLSSPSSDSPEPRRSMTMSRAKPARRVKKRAQPRVLPDVLDVVDVRADEQQVQRPVAVDLVGEVDVAVAGVAREGGHRRPLSARRPLARSQSPKMFSSERKMFTIDTKMPVASQTASSAVPCLRR